VSATTAAPEDAAPGFAVCEVPVVLSGTAGFAAEFFVSVFSARRHAAEMVLSFAAKASLSLGAWARLFPDCAAAGRAVAAGCGGATARACVGCGLGGVSARWPDPGMFKGDTMNFQVL
jgi:hypothetical protein